MTASSVRFSNGVKQLITGLPEGPVAVGVLSGKVPGGGCR